METNGSSSKSHDDQHSGGSKDPGRVNSAEKNVFVNYAEIAWHEKRKQWVGDPSPKPQKMPRESIISWTTTYEDLLCTTEPFKQPIPLAEMVDFLVDIWNEDGLYD